MEEKSIKWCFTKEIWDNMCNNSEYKENLGSIFDCEWCLKVAGLSSRIYVHLRAIGNIKECQVEVIFKNKKRVLKQDIFRFNSCDLEQSIGFIRFFVKDAFSTEIILIFKMRMMDTYEQQNSTALPEPSAPNSVSTNDKFDLCYRKALSEDLQAMIFDENLSDVTIKCNSEVFKVHKFMLCARSPVFKSMFANAMQEKATNIVAMNDKDPETVRSMIRFIYSGLISVNSIEEATCILDLSEQYQIQSLKAGMIEYFKSKVSLENAIKIFELADLYDERLKKDVIEFIGDHFDTLKQEKSWSDLKTSKPSLALEVYDHLH